MPADSSYAHLIAELGLALGIAGLAPSDEGICQLVFDGRQVVQLVHVGARGLVLLSCRLADHGIDARQAERMARANFLQAGRGVVLCAAPDGRPHMQVAQELAGCTAATLCAALESLLDQAESWSRAQARTADPASGGRDPAFFLQSV
ncbi:type III secretion system chaperone [Castellaniella defragrans]|uniref:Type III secretion system chaperone n=1 Tax=Castellaniella defragrans TaxID=75697 RepID=A0A7W9TPR3_CASDE|nr:type III secretion system chaperone [Castellaniella defragrans]KAB0607346.1 type III secretion system chaperone [Castellaniella defragrans]MBB6083532.1 hypothetical protein [Castellaniella defragrans]